MYLILYFHLNSKILKYYYILHCQFYLFFIFCNVEIDISERKNISTPFMF